MTICPRHFSSSFFLFLLIPSHVLTTYMYVACVVLLCFVLIVSCLVHSFHVVVVFQFDSVSRHTLTQQSQQHSFLFSPALALAFPSLSCFLCFLFPSGDPSFFLLLSLVFVVCLVPWPREFFCFSCLSLVCQYKKHWLDNASWPASPLWNGQTLLCVLSNWVMPASSLALPLLFSLFSRFVLVLS